MMLFNKIDVELVIWICNSLWWNYNSQECRPREFELMQLVAIPTMSHGTCSNCYRFKPMCRSYIGAIVPKGHIKVCSNFTISSIYLIGVTGNPVTIVDIYKSQARQAAFTGVEDSTKVPFFSSYTYPAHENKGHGPIIISIVFRTPPVEGL